MRGRDEGGRDDQGTKGLEDQGTRGPKKEKKSQKKKKKNPKINTSPIPKLGPKPEWFGHLGGILLQNQSPCSRIPKAAIQNSHPNTLIRMK